MFKEKKSEVKKKKIPKQQKGALLRRSLVHITLNNKMFVRCEATYNSLALHVN